MKPVTPNVALRGTGMSDGANGNPGHAVQNAGQAPRRPVSGINSPGDIRSNVADKPLKIPDFLQKR